MNRLMMRWPLMAEAENNGGGEAPKGEEQPKGGEEAPKKPVNLLDDPAGEEQPKGGEDEKAPTDEEQKAYRESIKAIDLGEGVKWDDPSLEAMTPELMRLTGNDPKKAEGIVKAYTAHQQAQVRAMQERQDKFLNGLVGECKKRFGDDLGRMCELAKAGGKKIFGDEIWNVMRKEPSFANNPDIIEKLAAFGRSEKDDPGVTAAQPKAAGGDRDWRESMYGKKK